MGLTSAVGLALTLALVVPFAIIGTVVATAISHVVTALLVLRLARRRLPGHTRSFLADVPWLPALLAAAVVVGLEVLARPLVPQGPLGLVLSGLVAAPGLVLFAAMTFGLGTSWQFLRDKLGRGGGEDQEEPEEGRSVPDAEHIDR